LSIYIYIYIYTHDHIGSYVYTDFIILTKQKNWNNGEYVGIQIENERSEQKEENNNRGYMSRM
jgi:hypothetical protein